MIFFNLYSLSYPFFLKKKSFLKGSTTLAKIKAMTLAETTQKPDFTTLEWPSQNSMKMKISQFVSLDPYSTAPYKYTSKPAKLDCRPSSFLSTLFSSFFSLLFSTFLSQRCFGQHISTTLFVFIQKGHSEVIFSFRPGKFLPAGAEGCVQGGGCVFFFF